MKRDREEGDTSEADGSAAKQQKEASEGEEKKDEETAKGALVNIENLMEMARVACATPCAVVGEVTSCDSRWTRISTSPLKSSQKLSLIHI